MINQLNKECNNNKELSAKYDSLYSNYNLLFSDKEYKNKSEETPKTPNNDELQSVIEELQDKLSHYENKKNIINNLCEFSFIDITDNNSNEDEIENIVLLKDYEIENLKNENESIKSSLNELKQSNEVYITLIEDNANYKDKFIELQHNCDLINTELSEKNKELEKTRNFYESILNNNTKRNDDNNNYSIKEDNNHYNNSKKEESNDEYLTEHSEVIKKMQKDIEELKRAMELKDNQIRKENYLPPVLKEENIEMIDKETNTTFDLKNIIPESEYEDEIQKYKNEIDSKECLINDFKGEIEKIKNEKEEVSNNYTLSLRTIDLLQTETKYAYNQINEYGKQIEGYKLQMETTIKEKNEIIEKNEIEIENLNKQLNLINSNDNNELNKLLIDANNKNSELSLELTITKDRVVQLENENENNKEEINKLKLENDSFKEKELLLNELENDKLELSKKVEELQNNINGLNKLIEENKSTKEKADEICNDYIEIESTNNILMEENKKLEEELKSVKDELNNYKEENSNLKQINTKRTEFKSKDILNNKKISTLELENNNLQKDVINLKQNYLKQNTKCHDILENINNIHEKINTKLNLIIKSSELNKELEEPLNEINDLENEINNNTIELQGLFNQETNDKRVITIQFFDDIYIINNKEKEIEILNEKIKILREKLKENVDNYEISEELYEEEEKKYNILIENLKNEEELHSYEAKNRLLHLELSEEEDYDTLKSKEYEIILTHTNNLENQLSELIECEKNPSIIEDIKEDIKKIKIERDDMEKKLEESRNLIKPYNESNNEIITKIKEVREQHKAIETELTNKKKEIEELEEEINKIKKNPSSFPLDALFEAKKSKRESEKLLSKLLDKESEIDEIMSLYHFEIVPSHNYFAIVLPKTVFIKLFILLKQYYPIESIRELFINQKVYEQDLKCSEINMYCDFINEYYEKLFVY